MQVQVIFNSKAISKQLATGWGLSCLVNRRILFDAGGKEKCLLQNIAILDIDISEITSVVISHEHYDHINGLWKLLEKRRGLKVYACPGFSLEFEKRVDALQCTLLKIDKFAEIEKNIFLTGEIAGTYNREYITEQALVVKSPKGLNVLTGCAHPGIINILKKVKAAFPDDRIYSVFGGFHLKDKNSIYIQNIAKKFTEMKIETVGATHCSGQQAEHIFKNIYKDKFIIGKAGQIFYV